MTAEKVSVFGVILVRIFPHWGCGKCGKMQSKITPNKDTFHTVYVDVTRKSMKAIKNEGNQIALL